MKTAYYQVAGLRLALLLNDAYCPEQLLPSFVPFMTAPVQSLDDPSLPPTTVGNMVVDGPVRDLDSAGRVPVDGLARDLDSAGGAGNVALTLVLECDMTMPDDARLLITETNDIGTTSIYQSSDGYFFQFGFMQSRASMLLRQDFTIAYVDIDLDRPYAGHLLSSVIRTAFAQTVVLHDGISLHASCVMLDGKGYLFMGKSGTGKSTHSRLWLDNFEGAELLNDDNPIVRLEDAPEDVSLSSVHSIGSSKLQKAMVYGSPWSGKTDCYKALCLPVGGVVRLSQAPVNSFERKTDVAAFLEIYPGCSVLRNNTLLHDRICDTLETLTAVVPVGHLNCRPDLAAAVLCRNSLF